MTTHSKVFVAVFACALPASAFAQQATSLDSLASLTFQHAETRKDIERAVKETGISEANVPCAATIQFDAAFGPLSGAFAGPYTCDFGSEHKKLFLESKAWVLVGTQKMDPAKNAPSVANAISRVSPEQVFLYEVLLKSRWVRE